MATSWFEKGRPALFEALASVCDQIGRDLHSEFLHAQNVEGDTAKTSKSKERTSKDGRPDIVARLEAENEELRKQLAILQRTNTGSNMTEPLIANSPCGQHLSEVSHASFNLPLTSSTLDATSTVDVAAGCHANCSKILRRYHAISANFKTAKDALQRKREESKKWVRYTAYLNQKILAAEEQHGIQILDGKVQRMEAPSSTAVEAVEQILDPTFSFATDASRHNEPQLPQLTAGPWPPDQGTSVPQATSDTTQGEASDALSQHLPALPSISDNETVRVKQEPSSDIPQIVAEREVRKRRHSDEAGTVARHRVKLEMTDSSSPISIPSANLHTQESLDLDIMQKMQTPRKRPMLDVAYPQTEVISRSAFANSTPARDLVQQQPQSAINSRVLMPLSVNVQMARHNNEKPHLKERIQQLGRGIANLVEDGAAYGDSSSNSDKKNLGSKSAKSRLGALLDRPPSAIDDENIIFRPVRNAEIVTPTRGANLKIPGRRRLPFEKIGAECNRSTPGQQPLAPYSDVEPKSRTVQHPSPQRGDQRVLGSLRGKPISQLCLEDFKVNPAANDGHEFVFSEVVRDKADRACLPGCIDMHCCGKHFRALAISQRPNSPLTPTQRQEEQKLLEEYLGDHSYRLATMDREERLELWIEAKTQELANKYGKHRHRYSRMQSPPGFWDADFPSTQQLEADREEAAKRTRRTVAERYREAMRPGGRWIFRDE